MTRWLLLLLLSGCAAIAQPVTLLPRGAGPQGTGMLDKSTYELTVTMQDGRRYSGKMIVSPGAQASAVLLGQGGGHMRCDLTFAAFMASANGVCTDSTNVVYDLLIK